MIDKGTVKLKLILLVLIFSTCLLNALPTPNLTSETNSDDVPEDVRRAQMDDEIVERDFDDSLVTRAFVNETNGTIYIQPVSEQKEEEDEEPELERRDDSIECDHYDESKCEKLGECSITKEVCHPEKHLKMVGCLAVFAYPDNLTTNSTDEYFPVNRSLIKTMGCMQYQHDTMMDCVDKKKCLQTKLTHAQIGMCCCKTPNCNVLANVMLINPDVHKESDASKGFWQSTPPSGMDGLGGLPIYWVLTTVLGGIFFFAILIALYVLWRCRQRQREEDEKKRRNCESEKTNVMEAGNLPLVDHEVMIEMVETPKELPITDFQLICKGRFGRVFKAKWKSQNGEEKMVAVKKLVDTQKSSFEAEKKIFEGLVSLPRWYANVVQFICAEKMGEEYWIVTEFHERLSLYELLKHNEISVTSCNRIIMSMVDGLQFLHDDRPFFFGHVKRPIIHRDIKSKNILIKTDMTACIADFGLAREYNSNIEKSDLLGQVGTKRYMSPEMLEGATEFTATAFKSMDVYSMGLVMWETINRTKLKSSDVVPEYQMPFQTIGFDPSIGIMRNHVVSKKERPQWRPEVFGQISMSFMAGVAEEMWDPEASARITAGCAFERVWTHVFSLQDCSEGYHSGNSLKDGKGGEDREEERRKNRRNDEMFKYHSKPNKPHPSPDPSLDDCPQLPPIPIITERGT
ncbi:CRE-DAF-4 protein [Caenorhabditis remanei]|uniref:Serine/threonine-protein kinase receptor n=1 Tax=Caenorhabditis remanei TaxID=31234 RepID=E3LYZ5_CAERE|nr:CRE-DAF-4 protein [Caenorhabditis remanei]